MKLKTTYLCLMLLAALAAACGNNTPTAAPATPAATPATSGDPVWDRVQSAGKIVFGTSADYAPFEYYDSSYQIIGFDPALARVLGSRLGLQVELVDIAFEGLPAALQTGQIDAAIAAISVTPERQAVVDFTNVYYSGQDAILARDGAGIGTVVAAAQLAQYRVAAERGSIYASWVRNTLVAPGLMPEANLLLYEKITDAVRDLREARTDLVLLDQPVAEDLVAEGGVSIVGQNLNRQVFAIALPKGAAALQAQLNVALTEVQNDGDLAKLVEDHLGLTGPSAPPGAQPSATPLPGPTATPAGCVDGMQFVADIQVPDGTQMSPGQEFDKVWRIRNTGTCDWTNSYRLAFVQGESMGGSQVALTTTVKPGSTYDLSARLKAPAASGEFTGIWHMVNGNGTPFGERIWVKVTVPGSAPPTAVPTATNVPAVPPTAAPKPTIDYLRANPESVRQGEVMTLSWSFSGQGLAAARLTRTNPDGTLTALNSGADVAQQGQYEDLMMTPGTYSYTLNVSAEFGGSTARTVVVTVTPGQDAPQPVQPTLAPEPTIQYLNASAETIQQGGLLVVSWSFSGEGLASAKLSRTNPDGTITALNSGADVAQQGQYEDLMMTPGTYVYTLNVGSEFGGAAVKTVTVNVNSN